MTTHTTDAPFITHECWEHETVRAIRDLTAGVTVCVDPDHSPEWVADRMAEIAQEDEIAWSQTVSHEGWHAVKGEAPCDNCTPEERAARQPWAAQVGFERDALARDRAARR